jgi:hypothetical protein
MRATNHSFLGIITIENLDDSLSDSDINVVSFQFTDLFLRSLFGREMHSEILLRPRIPDAPFTLIFLSYDLVTIHNIKKEPTWIE